MKYIGGTAGREASGTGKMKDTFVRFRERVSGIGIRVSQIRVDAWIRENPRSALGPRHSQNCPRNRRSFE